MNDLIARRLRATRERAGLTQSQMAAKLGFKERQPLAAIEAGQRKVSAEELLRMIEALGVDLDYLTDPFRLVGEGQFSWRAERDASPGLLDQFEDRAGRWIATYRKLGESQAELSPLKASLPLTGKSTYEEARAAAEALGREWHLGDVPALRLEGELSERLGALILYVDAPAGISGAACQLPGLATILVNRNEPAGRRNYDLAHETFHLLTWEQMPPEHMEGEIPHSGKGNRIEQLADNFASALLMPEGGLVPLWEARQGDIHVWLNETATHFQVTAVALKWRLVQLDLLSRADLFEIDDVRLKANGRSGDTQPPKLFSRRFMERIHAALDTGQLSVRRAAGLLDLSIEDLADLFRDHGLEVPFDL